MRAFNKISRYVLLLGLGFLPIMLTANIPTVAIQDTAVGIKKEFVKNYDKTFNVSVNHLVILANKYGKVDVKTGSNNQVVVKVKIIVNTGSQADADKVFDRINIAFSEGPDFVKTETTIESQNSGWNMIWNNNSTDYRIDYDVTMPVGNKLDLSNKYGDSRIVALNDWVKIDQKYGNFKIDGAGSMTIALAYGNGSIGKVGGLSGTVSYGKLGAEEAKNVQMKTKYSECSLNKLTTLDIQSAYDDYNVGDVNTAKIESKYGDIILGTVNDLQAVCAYTDCRIRKIENSAEFQTSYGDVKIESIKSGFGVVNMKGNYTDFTIGIEPSAAYHLDVKTSYGDISRPANLNYRIDKEKGSVREIMGYIGNENTKSQIIARLTYGDLKIR
jgi:hypothetical protein